MEQKAKQDGRMACYIKTKQDKNEKTDSWGTNIHEPCHQSLKSQNHSNPEKATHTEPLYSGKSPHGGHGHLALGDSF